MAPAPRFSPDEQERIILDAAAHCIEQSSLLDFTMSAIAKEAGLSMGSIYKHVQSKEDVLVALATRVQRHHYRNFDKMLALPLAGNQQIIAINLMDITKVSLYDFDQHLDILMNSSAMLKRASAPWRERLRTAELQIDALFSQFFRKLAIDGQLVNATEATVEELEVGSWAISVGYWQIARQYQLRTQPDPFADIELLQPTAPLIKALQRMLSTFNWQQPLTCERIVETCQILESHGLR